MLEAGGGLSSSVGRGLVEVGHRVGAHIRVHFRQNNAHTAASSETRIVRGVILIGSARNVVVSASIGRHDRPIWSPARLAQ